MVTLNVNFEAMTREEIEAIFECNEIDVDKREQMIRELLNLHIVSESYIKCWNCKHFTQTSTKHANKEVGNCGLHKCKVTDPKWQKCGEYDQCGLLTTFNFR